MKYAVTIVNQSGAPQKVALLFSDPDDNSLFPLVWLRKTISNEGEDVYCWDHDAFALGWGRTPRPVDNNMLFTSGATPVMVNPWAIDADNAISLTWQGGGFIALPAYHDRSLNGLLGIKTDRTFTVSQSETLNMALYLDKAPVVIMQGRPNALYQLDVSRFSYYLLVTDIMPGTVIPRLQLPARSRLFNVNISGVTKIEFKPGVTELKYKLNSTLQFIAC